VELVDQKGEAKKLMVGYIGKPYSNVIEVSGSGKKGNIKSSNTSNYQEHKTFIPQEARFC
jgi:hypothetical protein